MAFNRYSLDLEASNSQYAYVADNSALSITGDISIEFWMNLESTPGSNTPIISKWISSTQQSYLALVNTGRTIRFYFSDNAGNAVTAVTSAAITVGKWTHIAITSDVSASASGIKIYFNGIEQGIGSSSGTATSIKDGTANFEIGRNDGGTVYFDGKLSNVRLWSDIRTAQEITDNMYSILTGTSNNLVGSWFNDVNDYNDDAGTNNLTAVNTPVFSTNTPWTGANTTDWSNKLQLQSDHTKVPGTSNLTNFPALISSTNLTAAVYNGLNNGEYALDLELSSSQFAYIADGSQTGLDITTDFSIEAWVKLEQLPSNAGTPFIIVSKDRYGTGASRAYQLRIDNTGNLIDIFYFADNTNYTQIRTTTGFVAGDVGKWVHIAVAVDISAKTASFYKDGSVLDTTVPVGNATTIQNATADFYIGCVNNSGSGAGFFDGKLRNVRVWSDIRTQQEIVDNMTSTLSGTTNNLVSSWYNGANDHNDDSTGNNLTAVSTPTFVLNSYIENSLRITTDSAGTTEVPFEIVSLDTAGQTCEIWAKVPTLSYNSASSLYIWYGNSNAIAYDANAPFGSQAVWSGYSLVTHLNSNSNDSTNNSLNGTDTSATYSTSNGKITSGVSFNGSDSNISFADNDVYDFAYNQNFSISFWVKYTTGNSDGDAIIEKWSQSGSYPYVVRYNGSGSINLNRYDGTNSPALAGTTSLENNVFHYVVAQKNGSNLQLYFDGSYHSQTADTTTGTTTNTSPLYLGRRGSPGSQYFAGQLDELHILNNYKSADWISTEYNNQNSPSTFWTIIGSPSPSASESRSPSSSQSPSSSLSPSPSSSASLSLSSSISSSPSSSESRSISLSPSSSISASPSPSSSPSLSESSSPSPSPSRSISLSPSASQSPSSSPSVSESRSPSSSQSASQSSSPSPSEGSSPSSSQSPSSSLSPSPSSSTSPSSSESVSISLSPSPSPSSSESASPSVSPSLSQSPSPSVSESASESASQSPSSSISASPSSSESASESLSESATPSATPSSSPSASISLSPSVSESSSVSSSISPSPSPAEYEDMYTTSGNVYTDKYSSQTSTYIDKYKNWY